MAMRISATAVLLAVTAAVLVKPVEIAGGSMEPVLHDGEIRLCIRFAPFGRGDVVCVRYGRRLIVKRVAAVAGDMTPLGRVPEGMLYLTGDCAEVSVDSRSGLGFVPKRWYVGRIFV